MRNGQELSELGLFIGDDGKLSIFHDDHECEVTGVVSNVFGESLIGKVK